MTYLLPTPDALPLEQDAYGPYHRHLFVKGEFDNRIKLGYSFCFSLIQTALGIGFFPHHTLNLGKENLHHELAHPSLQFLMELDWNIHMYPSPYDRLIFHHLNICWYSHVVLDVIRAHTASLDAELVFIPTIIFVQERNPLCPPHCTLLHQHLVAPNNFCSVTYRLHRHSQTNVWRFCTSGFNCWFHTGLNRRSVNTCQ